MKIRTDFVTNSSSSSFICEICGASESGYDYSASDCGMIQCENGHVICQEHLLYDAEYTNRDAINQYIKGNDDSDYESLNYDEAFDHMLSCGGGYEIPSCFCPICQFNEYSQKDLAAYLLKKYKVDREKVFEDIKKINKRRKKLYDEEYNTYVCKENNLNPAEIVESWRKDFGDYRKFKRYIDY